MPDSITTLNYPGMPSEQPFTVHVQSPDSLSLDEPDSYTTLQIGGGYVGMPLTQSAGGYRGVQTIDAPGGMPRSKFSDWIQANKTTVYLAAGAFVLMAMFGGGRRR
jgi:hypothetical protein